MFRCSKRKNTKSSVNIGGKCFEGSSDHFILRFPMQILAILLSLSENIYMWLTKLETETCMPQAQHIL